MADISSYLKKAKQMDEERGTVYTPTSSSSANTTAYSQNGPDISSYLKKARAMDANRITTSTTPVGGGQDKQDATAQYLAYLESLNLDAQKKKAEELDKKSRASRTTNYFADMPQDSDTGPFDVSPEAFQSAQKTKEESEAELAWKDYNLAKSLQYWNAGEKALGELSADVYTDIDNMAKRNTNRTLDVTGSTETLSRLLNAGYTEEEIEQLVDYRVRQINRDEYDEQVQRMVDLANKGFGGAVAASAESVPMSLMSGAGYVDLAVQKARNAITGNDRPLDYYTPAMSFYGQSNAARTTVTENIEENAKTEIGGKIESFFYNTGMSMADFVAASPLGGAGMVLLGGSAATATAVDIRDRGGNDTQALLGGALAGAAEAVFENESLKSLFALSKPVAKETLRSGFKRVLMNVGKQGWEEGKEELFTSLANAMTDRMVMGELSSYNTAVRDYMANGLSAEEAERKATLDFIVQCATDTLAGFVSGGVLGGVSTAARGYEASHLYGDDAEALITEALEIDPNNAFAQEMQGRVETGKRIGGNALADLVEQNEETLLAQDKETIQRAAAERLSALGETGDVQNLAAVIAKKTAGEKLTQAEQKTIAKSKYGQRILNELNPENISNETHASEWAENLETNRINVEAYRKALEEAKGKTLGDVAHGQIADTLTKHGYRLAESPETGETEQAPADTPAAPFTAQASARATTIEDMAAEIGRQQLAANDVVYQAATEKFGEDRAFAVAAAYRAGNRSLGVSEFLTGFNAAYESGVKGTPLQETLDAQSDLLPGQIKVAWSLGNDVRTGKVEARSVKRQGTGTFTDKSTGKATDSWQAFTTVLEGIAKKTGIDIETVDAIKAGSKTANGKMVRDMMTIVLSRNAENNMQALGHELSEFVEAFNPDDMASLRMDILRYWAHTQSATSVNALVSAYQGTYKKVEGGKTYEQAEAEAINDALGAILASEEGVDALMEWLQTESGMNVQEQKTFLQKLADLFQNIINGLKKLLKEGGLTPMQQDMVHMEIEQKQDILKRLFAAVDQAALNARETGEYYADITQAEAGIAIDRETDTARSLPVDRDTSRSYNEGKNEEDEDYEARGIEAGERPESRREFLERVQRGIYRIKRFGRITAAYEAASAIDKSYAAETAKRELNALGIPTFYFRQLEVNDGNMTTVSDGETCCIAGRVVGIRIDAASSGKDFAGVEFAGHEAFHFWLANKECSRFVAALLLHENSSTPYARQLKREVTNLYGRKRTKADNALIYEEYLAKIAGQIHSGGYEPELRTMFTDYDAVKAAWDKVVDAHRKTKGDTAYSISPEYSHDLEDWFARKKPNRERLYLGTTSVPLRSVGVDDKDIFWKTSKINKIQKEHIFITDDVLRQVPYLLENPVLIMESKTQPNRVALLGEVYSSRGIPVLGVLELLPTSRSGYELENIEVANAYAKDKNNPEATIEATQGLIDTSEILYIDPNKKRTNTWLSTNRLQLPLAENQYGSIGRVTLLHRDVNGYFSFGPKAQQKTALAAAFEKANATKDTEGDEALSLPVDEQYLVPEGADVALSVKIKRGMSEQERYDILKDRSLMVTARADLKKLDESEYKLGHSTEDAGLLSINDRKRLFKKLGDEFKVYKSYTNTDVRLSFSFSKGNMGESTAKQHKNYKDFAKLFSCFDDVIDAAIGIEVHNRNEEGYKPDPTLKDAYVLVSAFEDGDYIIPVKLEIKEFFDKDNTLHVAVALERMKKDEVVKQGNTNNGVTQYSRSSIVMLADLLKNVNPADVSFLKYIPKQFFETHDTAHSVSPNRVSMTEMTNREILDIRYSLPVEAGKYSYEWFVSKPDMTVTAVTEAQEYDRKTVVKNALKNAALVGRSTANGNAAISVQDIGKEVIITKKSLVHGLDRRLGVQAPVLENIGHVLQNAIRVNELTPRRDDVEKTYVLIGMARGKNGAYIASFVVNSITDEVAAVDVLYAVNAKKEPAALLPKFTGKPATPTDSTIRIADLLDYVKEYFPDILPEDVLRHYGYDSRPSGNLGEDALFSLPVEDESMTKMTNREILEAVADQAEKADLTPGELDALRIFKTRLDKVRDLQQQRAEQGTLWHDQQFGGKSDEAVKTMNRMKVLDSQLDKAEKALVKAESTGTLKGIVDRAYKAGARKQRIYDDNTLRRYKERRDNADSIKKYRKNVEEKAKKLTEMLLRNSDKQHIPEQLKAAVGEFLTSIDFTSKRQLHGGEATKKDLRYTDTLNKLRRVLQNQVDYMNDPEKSEGLGVYLDMPDGFVQAIDKHIAEVKETLRDVDIVTGTVNIMTADELADLDFFLTVLTSSINKVNALIANGRYQYVSEAAMDTITHLNEMKEFGGKHTKVGKFLNWDNTTPVYAFKRFGDAGSAIFEGLQDGWDKLAINSKQVIDFAEKTYTEKEVKAWSEKIHNIELDGRTAQMTTAQIMSLYCLVKREQARGHLFGGGMRIGNIEVKAKVENGKAKGKQDLQQAEAFHLTLEDVARITSLLTDRQIAVADALQKYMNTVGSKWGNEVSFSRFGYNSFTEENYFPIESDKNNLPAIDPAARADDLFRLLNMCFTKGLTPKANNALVVNNIFDVFAAHMSDMAKYNALALPVLDAMKFYNFKESTKDESGKLTTATVQKAIERAYGSPAKGYFIQFMKDLNGVHDGGRNESESFAMKMVGNYKVAAVGANLRVALLQPTSYVRAVAAIDPKYLAKAVTMKPATKEMQENSGIAVWKSLGFYDTNIGRAVRDQIKGEATVRDKVVEASMAAAALGDKVTWGVLWNACKLECAAKGDKSAEAVAKRFREVVYATQVVDSTMTRSQTMRSSSSLTKMLTSFMSEPTLAYNMLVDSFNTFSTLKRKGDKNAWQKCRQPIARSMMAYVAAMTAAALAESIFDALRDDDDYETFLEKFWEAFWGDESGYGGKPVAGNLAADLNPINKLPILKDIVSEITGYENTRMDTQWFSSIIDAFEAWKSETRPLYGKIYKTMQALSRFTGLPVSNLMREVVTIYNNTIGVITGDKLKTYEPSVRTSIKEALAGGHLTEDEAMRELVDKGEAKDMNDAYFIVKGWATGDASRYQGVYDAMLAGESITAAVRDLTSHGYEEDDVLSAIKAQIGKWYRGTDDKPASITKQQALSMLTKHGDMTHDEASDKVDAWEFQKEHPTLDWSEGQITTYYSKVAPSGISVTVYDDYLTLKSSCKGTDTNGDGKTDSGSVKEEVLQVIHKLPITSVQKDTLYYLNGWSESTIHEAQWH